MHLHTHHTANGADLTGTAATGAGLHLSVSRAGTLTIGAVLDAAGGYFLFRAESGLFKGQLQPGAHIFTPTGGILGILTGSATAEELTENITEVKATEAAKTTAKGVAAGTTAIAGIYTGKAELVITGALFIVGQHSISLAQLLELLLGFLVAGVAVRVVLHCVLAVGFFDFLGAGALLYAQHLIVIAFIFCHFLHLYLVIANQCATATR